MMNNLEEFVILALNAFTTVRIDRYNPTTQDFELYLRRALMQKQVESAYLKQAEVKPTKTLLQG